VPQARKTADVSLEREAPPRIRDDAPGEREPVARHSRRAEPPVAAQAPDLAERQEVVGRPVPLVSPELRRAVGVPPPTGEARHPPHVVMRLEQEEPSARSHHAAEGFEDALPLIEVMEALD